MGQDQLQAAIAWQYCQGSAQWALGQQTGNRMAEGILWALLNEPLRMTCSEIGKISLVEIVPTSHWVSRSRSWLTPSLPSALSVVLARDAEVINTELAELEKVLGFARLIAFAEVPPLPDTLPPEMPASWWERMHLGASDDAIGSEDARLVFTHIFQRLIDQEIATEALRQPSARARIATAVGGPRQRARKC